MTAQPKKRTPVLLPIGSKSPTCVHGRMIDEVLLENGQRSGQVRCLECFTVFADPYGGLI